MAERTRDEILRDAAQAACGLRSNVGVYVNGPASWHAPGERTVDVTLTWHDLDGLEERACAPEEAWQSLVHDAVAYHRLGGTAP